MDIVSCLKFLQKSQFFPSQQLQELQLLKLNRMLSYIHTHVPLYAEMISDKIYLPLTDLSEIQKLPFLTKEMIRQFPQQLTSTEHFKYLTKKTTSGSTGEPLTIYKTADAMARELAATWRGYSWAEIDIGDKQARFWGIPFTTKERIRAKLIDFVANRRRCSAFSFDESNLKFYTNSLASFKPKYFYGYVSMIEEYAKYFEERNIKPPFNLNCVITTSEVLTDYHRKLIENVFSARVFNEYGCGELGSVAHECNEGSMHLMAENMIVEILNGDMPCKPGQIGELVITELNNKAMPLIRYRTGDFASFSSEQCRCKRSLPMIGNLMGRAYDIIKNRNGKLFHGEFFLYVMEEAKKKGLGIEAFQVRQMDYERFKIKIVAGLGYSKNTELFIANRIKQNFDPNAKIEFLMVDKIPREASGKMRVVVGMMGQDHNLRSVS